MATPPFVLQLVSLRCMTAQENDGDETYIQVDDHVVWSVGAWRMSGQPRDDAQMDEVDFLHGQYHTQGGWVAMQDFDPDHYRIEVHGDQARLLLRERDLLLGDDTLGDVPISRQDAGHGRIQLAFTAEGAYYVLEYRVTA